MNVSKSARIMNTSKTTVLKTSPYVKGKQNSHIFSKEIRSVKKKSVQKSFLPFLRKDAAHREGERFQG